MRKYSFPILWTILFVWIGIVIHDKIMEYPDTRECGEIYYKGEQAHTHKHRTYYTKLFVIKYNNGEYVEKEPTTTDFYTYKEGDIVCYKESHSKGYELLLLIWITVGGAIFLIAWAYVFTT